MARVQCRQRTRTMESESQRMEMAETMPCSRAELPRLYELRDCIAAPASPDACFQDFDQKLSNSAHIKEVYLRWERVLQGLDDQAWEHLKKEAAPHLASRDKKGRGWQQLFDILNEARAYNYLRSIGCTRVRFIPRSRERSPDLEGAHASDRVLCEVKTINTSDEEIAARRGPPKARSLPINVTPGFLKKLRSTVEAAKQQMLDYDPNGGAVHLVYLNVLFDDFFAERKEAYFQQMTSIWPMRRYQAFGLSSAMTTRHFINRFRCAPLTWTTSARV